MSGVRVLAFALVLLVAGCLRFGVPPRVDRLGELKPAASTQSDVLLVLGEPRGRGHGQLSRAEREQEIWFYEFGEATGPSVNTKFLLVFFDREIYSGYFWFSSHEGRSAGF